MKTCSIEGCIGVHYGRGWCNKHYQAWRRNGDPIKRFVAEIGSGHVDQKGYKIVYVDGKRVKEHIVIAEKALGRKLKYPEQVHHVNGDRTDNRPENLIICPDNAYHKLLHKRQKGKL